MKPCAQCNAASEQPCALRCRSQDPRDWTWMSAVCTTFVVYALFGLLAILVSVCR